MNQLRTKIFQKSAAFHARSIKTAPILAAKCTNNQRTYSSSGYGGNSFKKYVPGALALGTLGSAFALYAYMEKTEYSNTVQTKRESPFSYLLGKSDKTESKSNQSSHPSLTNSATSDKTVDPVTSAPIYVNDKESRFPTHVPYLIIGAGTAGLSAAKAIRASDSTAKVLMIGGDLQTGEGPAVIVPVNNEGTIKELKQPPPYLRPPLSKELWRRNEERRQALIDPDGNMRKHSWIYFEPESYFVEPENLDLLNYGAIALHRNDPVVSLNTEKRVATLKSGRQVTFESCLIATGCRPKRFPVAERCSKSGEDLLKDGRVSYFRSMYDFNKLKDLAANYCKSGGTVLVVGGGFLGCELVTSLRAYADREKSPKMLISHMFRETSPMGHVLPPNLSAHIGRFEESRQIRLAPSTDLVSVEKIAPGDSSAAGRLRVRYRKSAIGGQTSLEEMIVDHIVCAVGVEPCVDFADEAGLEIDQAHGGYLVNAEMQSRAGIYVAGDAASYWDPILGCRRRVEHLNFAEETGILAGKNMAASRKNFDSNSSLNDHDPNALDLHSSAKYHFQSSLWSNLGKGILWDAIGHVDSRNLETYGFFAKPESQETSDNSQSSGLNVKSSTESNFGPGVVFYVTPREKRLVGILLWNLPEEIYEDDNHPAPSRLNLARSILAKRMQLNRKTLDRDLQSLARDFDIYSEIKKDYKELTELIDKVKEEEESHKHD